MYQLQAEGALQAEEVEAAGQTSLDLVEEAVEVEVEEEVVEQLEGSLTLVRLVVCR